MGKQYSLLSTEPLTEFENDMVQSLQSLADRDCRPRAAVLAVLDEDGNIGTYYHNASMSDMILMHGFIGLDIQERYMEINYPGVTGEDGDGGEGG